MWIVLLNGKPHGDPYEQFEGANDEANSLHRQYGVFVMNWDEWEWQYESPLIQIVRA